MPKWNVEFEAVVSNMATCSYEVEAATGDEARAIVRAWLERFAAEKNPVEISEQREFVSAQLIDFSGVREVAPA